MYRPIRVRGNLIYVRSILFHFFHTMYVYNDSNKLAYVPCLKKMQAATK
jgi:hypothetical protein